MDLESVLATAILIIALLIFVLMFAFIALTFIRGFRMQAYQPTTIRVEDYACPKCGSKDLEPIGRRTLRCKRCGTTFTIQPETAEVHWMVWPFFWWIPILWPIPVRKN